MARRPGLKAMSLDHVERRLRRERAGQEDRYAPLAEARIGLANPLAPVTERYHVSLGDDRSPARLGGTALAQICQIAGVPPAFLERAPASIGLKSLRAMLEIAAEASERQHLWRLRLAKTPVVRAVLPQGYVRFDDVDVFAELGRVAGGMDLRAVNVDIDDDCMFVRLVRPEAFDVGTLRAPDLLMPGIDVITSETGQRPLEVRHVLVRVVCLNGMTQLSDQQKALRTRYTRLDRAAFQEVVRATMAECLQKGGTLAEKLAKTRDSFTEDPAAEIERIFTHYRLGNPKGRVAHWVSSEVVRHVSLFGVRRFDIVQAFTAVARGLVPGERLRIEDAMGSYLLDGPARA